MKNMKIEFCRAKGGIRETKIKFKNRKKKIKFYNMETEIRLLENIETKIPKAQFQLPNAEVLTQNYEIRKSEDGSRKKANKIPLIISVM